MGILGWNPLTDWNTDRVQRELGLTFHPSTFIAGLARSIGPLVKLYRATGLAAALDLAVVLADKALADYFTDEGRYDRDAFGTHTHSVTCVMSSLAQLADLMGDATLMDRVRAFYDNGLWELRDEIGWSPEAHGQTDTDHGEANNTGDILETALILGRWGHTRCYHDAERILRMHLLPCQLRDVSFVEEPENPDGIDGLRDVANRHLGAFGFPAPYGHQAIGKGRGGVSFNMDIVGGVVGSLCEALREVTRMDACGHHVNLLFNHETEDIRVESPYTHDCLRVRVKESAPLFVRIPSWVSTDDLHVAGAPGTVRLTNGCLFLPEPPVDQWIAFPFDLPERQITLKHRTRNIRVRLRGDEVIAMDNFGADLTFFDPIEA